MKPGLSEVPERAGGVFCVVGCGGDGLRGEGADIEGIVLFRDPFGEVRNFYLKEIRISKIVSSTRKHIHSG